MSWTSCCWRTAQRCVLVVWGSPSADLALPLPPLWPFAKFLPAPPLPFAKFLVETPFVCNTEAIHSVAVTATSTIWLPLQNKKRGKQIRNCLCQFGSREGDSFDKGMPLGPMHVMPQSVPLQWWAALSQSHQKTGLLQPFFPLANRCLTLPSPNGNHGPLCCLISNLTTVFRFSPDNGLTA